MPLPLPLLGLSCIWVTCYLPFNTKLPFSGPPVRWVVFWAHYSHLSSLHSLIWWKTCLWEWSWLLLNNHIVHSMTELGLAACESDSCILGFDAVQHNEEWVSAGNSVLEIPASWKCQIKAIDKCTRKRTVPVEKWFKKLVQERLRQL